MGTIGAWIVAVALAGAVLPHAANAASGVSASARAAAEKAAGLFVWQEASALEADFSCTGKVQQAILGVSGNEIAVAIFNQGLDQKPALLRFEADEHNILAAKIRIDDYTLTAEEITDVSGAAPAGYRQSTTCHGVRLSDDGSQAAHIYWDHDHQRFDTWTQ